VANKLLDLGTQHVKPVDLQLDAAREHEQPLVNHLQLTREALHKMRSVFNREWGCPVRHVLGCDALEAAVRFDDRAPADSDTTLRGLADSAVIVSLHAHDLGAIRRVRALCSRVTGAWRNELQHRDLTGKSLW
jgi:hypothetical protein